MGMMYIFHNAIRARNGIGPYSLRTGYNILRTCEAFWLCPARAYHTVVLLIRDRLLLCFTIKFQFSFNILDSLAGLVRPNKTATVIDGLIFRRHLRNAG